MGGEARGYRQQESETFIAKHAARHADREAEVRDKALDAIDEAITRFRSDLKATEQKLVNGEWVEEPVMRLTPKDVAVSSTQGSRRLVHRRHRGRRPPATGYGYGCPRLSHALRYT